MSVSTKASSRLPTASTTQSWFEESVFKDVWGRAISELEEAAIQTRPHLLSPTSAPDGLKRANFGPQAALQAEVAHGAVFSPGQACHREDVVMLRDNRVGEVWLHMRLPDGRLITLINCWQPEGSNKFKMCGTGGQFVQLTDVKHICLFHKENADVATVVP